MNITTRLARLGAGAMAATALAAGASVALAAPASASDGAPTLGNIEDSLVHVLTTYTGYVQYPDGEWSDPIQVAGTCTGWFASDEGHIATAGHCVQDAGADIHAAIVSQFLLDAVGEVTEADFVEVLGWPIEGQDQGSDIDRIIEVVQPGGADDPVITQLTVAQLVDYQDFENGDAALLRVAGVSGTVPLSVAAGVVEVGDEITSIGFPATVGEVVDVQRLAASFKTGTVSSRQVLDSGSPVIEINAQVSAGMSGGPTINENGAVVGINSFKINGETQSFNFVTDTEGLTDFLSANGVEPFMQSGGAADADASENAAGTARTTASNEVDDPTAQGSASQSSGAFSGGTPANSTTDNGGLVIGAVVSATVVLSVVALLAAVIIARGGRRGRNADQRGNHQPGGGHGYLAAPVPAQPSADM